jgi:hypothetical protein
VHNVTITGAGVVNGNGALVDGTPDPGSGCKMFGFVDSIRITLSGFTTHNGGWFTILVREYIW